MMAHSASLQDVMMPRTPRTRRVVAAVAETVPT